MKAVILEVPVAFVLDGDHELVVTVERNSRGRLVVKIDTENMGRESMPAVEVDGVRRSES